MNQTFCRWMSNELQVDVVTYDYVGYGLKSAAAARAFYLQTLALVFARIICCDTVVSLPLQLRSTQRSGFVSGLGFYSFMSVGSFPHVLKAAR